MTGHETGRMCSTQNMLGWVTEMSHAKRTCKAVYLQVAVYAATGRRRTLLRGYCLQGVCLQCVYLLCMQQRIPLAIDVPVSGTETNRTCVCSNGPALAIRPEFSQPLKLQYLLQVAFRV